MLAGMQENEPERKPDWYDYFGHMTAAAILIPFLFWAQEHVKPHLAAWIRSFGSG